MKTVLDSVDKAMSAAKALSKKGNTAKAIQIYQAVLARYPKNRRAAVALQKLQKSMNPAATASADPPTAEIQQFKTLLNAKKFEQALAIATSMRKKYPRAAVAPNMAGTALIMLGRFEDAVVQLEAAVGLQPNNHDIICNLAGAHLEAENYSEAYQQYSKAINLRPDHGPAYSNRARACFEVRKYEDAIEDAKMALSIDPDDIMAKITLGRAHFGFFQLNEALACFDAVLKRHPNSPRALSGRASALVSLGRIPAALAEYERSLELNPGLVTAHYSISKLKKYTPDDPQIKAMLDLAENAELDNRSRAQLLVGLSNAYEKLGDTTNAFHYLALGNKARDDDNDYSISKDQKLFADIKSYFTENPPEPLNVGNADATVRPIFIVGMPRSGTTLTEQILASHSQVHGAGELQVMGKSVNRWFNDDRPRPKGDEARTMLKHIRKSYFADTHVGAATRPNVTDKMPMNFLWIGFILAAIPEAQIIHLTRDPMAVCWSNYRQLFSTTGLKYAYDLKNLGMYYSLYQNLMAFWHDLYPGQIYDLNYETLTRDQEHETRQLLDACGLPWEEGCLDFHRNTRSISTASATQVRKKMYQGSSQAWKVYEDELVTLRDALGASLSS